MLGGCRFQIPIQIESSTGVFSRECNNCFVPRDLSSMGQPKLDSQAGKGSRRPTRTCCLIAKVAVDLIRKRHV